MDNIFPCEKENSRNFNLFEVAVPGDDFNTCADRQNFLKKL